MELKVIAKIYTDFKEKFGIPRQSGILTDSVGKIVFEKEYRIEEAVRGLDGFSHLWLLWQFSKTEREDFSPTVRPPRLGGNKRVGVFATRSPYRPNAIGLSSVKLLKIEKTKDLGVVLYVLGADILDGTPIFDIKPYLKFTDCHEDAVGGFSDGALSYKIKVNFPEKLLSAIKKDKQKTLISLLENDPRPAYKSEGEEEYGMLFSEYEIFFKVKDGTLTVTRVSNVSR